MGRHASDGTGTQGRGSQNTLKPGFFVQEGGKSTTSLQPSESLPEPSGSTALRIKAEAYEGTAQTDIFTEASSHIGTGRETSSGAITAGESASKGPDLETKGKEGRASIEASTESCCRGREERRKGQREEKRGSATGRDQEQEARAVGGFSTPEKTERRVIMLFNTFACRMSCNDSYFYVFMNLGRADL